MFYIENINIDSKHKGPYRVVQRYTVTRIYVFTVTPNSSGGLGFKITHIDMSSLPCSASLYHNYIYNTQLVTSLATHAHPHDRDRIWPLVWMNTEQFDKPTLYLNSSLWPCTIETLWPKWLDVGPLITRGANPGRVAVFAISGQSAQSLPLTTQEYNGYVHARVAHGYMSDW